MSNSARREDRSRLRLVADRAGPPRPPRNLLLTAAALALGVGLLVLAAPRIMAALYALPARPVIAALDKPSSPQPTPAELVQAQQALQLAQLWQRDALLGVELARIDLILAVRQIEAGLNARPLLDRTIATAQLALHRGPAQARGWLILAEASLARDGLAAPGLVAFLGESLRASPYDVWLAPNRTWLALQLWDRLDEPSRAIAAEQMRMMVQLFGLDYLVRMARQLGAPDPARQALARTPRLREQFEARYLQL